MALGGSPPEVSQVGSWSFTMTNERLEGGLFTERAEALRRGEAPGFPAWRRRTTMQITRFGALMLST
ncbi:MAG: hypothetical protein CMJ34_11290 [Phycisphaerae bacterium]|nr:hypothetical protein [Phycisphaerae bacterium]